MYSLLHIDSSVRAKSNSIEAHNSISRNIAGHLISELEQANAIAEYSYRDVGANPPDFITQEWIGAVFTSEEKRTTKQKALLEQSDEMIDELVNADLIIISAPMYNYGMPAHLKAWFDQIVRVDKTFSFDLSRGDFPLEPIHSGKEMVLITSSGEFGFHKGGIREKMNHLAPHIETLSKYLGVEKMTEIACEYQEFSDERHEASKQAAYRKASDLAESLSQREKLN
ncbi:FMN-dependent NADH-azoreductase [Oceanospirillum sanctuarii]|uniref:FMN-dependent NADH-azoreductase n=1 Tax=Oceanospirillum sanctuarii TaxID=1434821 RepID=UPI000A3A6C89|nr:NAD(P)H-dependent oxidoreductase [Oceanospirillum sanctuarii]